MSARVYFMKTVNCCKDVSTTVCSQNINKQIVNISDENLTDYSFLSRYHFNKSKNFLRRQYRIRHSEFPCFFGTPCITIESIIISLKDF